MIRTQIRCPPPGEYSRRSGAFVIDLHGIKLSNTDVWTRHHARFTNNDPVEPVAATETFVFGAEFTRLVIACSPVHEKSAVSIFSMGSLDLHPDALDAVPRFEPSTLAPPLRPRLKGTRSKPNTTGTPSIMALSVDIPSIHVDITKPILDSLQYWADDVAQLFDSLGDGKAAEKDASRDASLIGSRFFTKSRSGSRSALSANNDDMHYETVIKITVSEGEIKYFHSILAC